MRMLLAILITPVLIVVIVKLAFPQAFSGLVGDFAQLFENYQNESRWPIWVNSIAMIRDHLMFGVGAGNWMVYYPKYHMAVAPDYEVGPEKQHINAHQDYLEIFSELGLVGFVFLMWLLISVFLVTLRMVWTMKSQHVFLVIGIATAVFGLAVNSFVSFGMQQPLPICMLMIYAALIGYYWREERGAGKSWLLRDKRAVNVKTVTVALASMALVILHYSWYRSEVSYRLALGSNNTAQAMLRHAETALQWAPGRTRALNFIAKAYADKGDRNHAIKSYRTLLADYPYMLHTLQNAGAILGRFGLRAEARELYLRLLECRPHPYMYREVGRQLIGLGYQEEGIALLRSLVEHKGYSPDLGTRNAAHLTPYNLEEVRKIVLRYDAYKRATASKNQPTEQDIKTLKAQKGKTASSIEAGEK
jgi:hypothetical protein